MTGSKPEFHLISVCLSQSRAGRYSSFGAVAAIYAAPAAETPAGQVLWFSKPAGQIDKSDATRKTAINDAFPIGNGSAGALVCGGVPEELLRLNEISLWTGGLNPKGDYNTMGAYQALGDLRIALSGSGKATDYRRALDLGHSLAIRLLHERRRCLAAGILCQPSGGRDHRATNRGQARQLHRNNRTG